MRALFGLFLALLVPSASAQSPDVGVWENVSFGTEGPGVGGSLISAMVAAPNGDVFATGYFSTIGGTRANNIARWDGTAWHALGDGLTFYASSLAVGPAGSLYAAGVSAVGVPGYGVVKWDGQSWTALGDIDGTSGDGIEAVAVGADGTVYVGIDRFVQFSDNGYYVGRVDRWTGTEWVQTASLGPTVPYASSLTGLAVTTDGTLYAARETYASVWNGVSWRSIGGGQIDVLTAGADGGLYASGSLDIDLMFAQGVARWDGAAWSRLGDASDGYGTEALAVSAGGTVYAGGRFRTFAGTESNGVARWDGASWRPIQGGVGKAATGNFQTTVRALALSPDGTLHVGGRFDTAGGTFSPNLARWRGDAWQSNGGGIVGTVRALTRTADGRAVIGGSFRIAGGQIVNSIAVQNGDSWAPLGTGPYETYYASIAAAESDRNGDLIACGQGTFRWNGSSWNRIASGPENCRDIVADGAGTIYAAGSSSNGPNRQGVWQWDGSTWNSLGDPTGTTPSVTQSVTAAHDGTLYATGRFGVARYDADDWVALGPIGGSGSPVVYKAVVGPDGTLYAGGQFDTIGGTEARNVARWDGTSWRALGAGTDQAVRTLLVDPARGVYAGGDFTEAGSASASRIALWNGAAWERLGAGTDGSVYTLLADGPNGLFVGGEFAKAGETVSPYVARWTARPVTGEAPAEVRTLGITLAPNPAMRASAITVTHAAGPVTVEVLDLLGRRVAVLAEGEAAAGTRTLPLDTSRLAPGVYAVRVQASAETRTRQLVVVR